MVFNGYRNIQIFLMKLKQILRTISLIIFKHSGVYPTFYFFFISNRIKFVVLGGEGGGVNS